MLSRTPLTLVALITMLALSATLPAQQPPQSATQFYMAYKAAFHKAKSMNELFPYMAKEKLEQVKSASAADLKMMWSMAKDLYVFSGEKVVKETATPSGATLEVQAVDPEKNNYRATVTLVKQNNAWKFLEEDWSPAK